MLNMDIIFLIRSFFGLASAGPAEWLSCGGPCARKSIRSRVVEDTGVEPLDNKEGRVGLLALCEPPMTSSKSSDSLLPWRLCVRGGRPLSSSFAGRAMLEGE